MPTDLRKRLQKFLNNIYRIIERNAIDINAAADIVDSMLSTINIAKYWDEMNLLLELDCVKSLDLRDSRKLIRDIKAGKRSDDIKDFFSLHIPDHDISRELISKQSALASKYPSLGLDYAEDWNLKTCLSEAIRKKPVKGNGMLSLINEDDDYFIRKYLVIYEPQGFSQRLNGDIKKYSKAIGKITIGLNTSYPSKYQTQ